MDETFVEKILEMYPILHEKLNYITDKGLLWEMLKMELRSLIISYSKDKAIKRKNRECDIKECLEELDAKNLS